MNRLFILFLICTVILSSCVKWPFWPGNQEYIYVDYSNIGGMPKIVNFFSSKFVSIDTCYTEITGDTSKIILDGIRIQKNWTSYKINESSNNALITEERTLESPNWSIKSEFSNGKTFTKSKVACVLVLDMSTSIVDVVGELKNYAKSFIDKITLSSSDSKIAVVFFSGKNNITETNFYDLSNISELKTKIDIFNDFHDRTALYDATIRGIKKLSNFQFDGSKELVVFSDGGDNDSDAQAQKIIEIQSNPLSKTIIALKGADFRTDKKNYRDLVGNKSNFVVANDTKDLSEIFTRMASQISQVYKLVYKRSVQEIQLAEIRIKLSITKTK